MSIWNNLFDSEYKRRSDIDKNHKALRSTRNANMKLKTRVSDLEDQIGELTLLCRSLLTVLRENEIVQPEHLDNVMKRLDAEDGSIDGKISESTDGPPSINAW